MTTTPYTDLQRLRDAVMDIVPHEVDDASRADAFAALRKAACAVAKLECIAGVLGEMAARNIGHAITPGFSVAFRLQALEQAVPYAILAWSCALDARGWRER